VQCVRGYSHLLDLKSQVFPVLLYRSVAAEKVECEKLEIKKSLQSFLAQAEAVGTEPTQELVRLLHLLALNPLLALT